MFGLWTRAKKLEWIFGIKKAATEGSLFYSDKQKAYRRFFRAAYWASRRAF